MENTNWYWRAETTPTTSQTAVFHFNLQFFIKQSKQKKTETSTLLGSLLTGRHNFSNHNRPSSVKGYIVYVECWVVASLTLVLLPTRAFGADSSDRILLQVTRAEGLPNHRHGARQGHCLRHTPRTLQVICLGFWVAHLADTNSTNRVQEVRGAHHVEPEGWTQSEQNS